MDSHGFIEVARMCTSMQFLPWEGSSVYQSEWAGVTLGTARHVAEFVEHLSSRPEPWDSSSALPKTGCGDACLQSKSSLGKGKEM